MPCEALLWQERVRKSLVLNVKIRTRVVRVAHPSAVLHHYIKLRAHVHPKYQLARYLPSQQVYPVDKFLSDYVDKSILIFTYTLLYYAV